VLTRGQLGREPQTDLWEVKGMFPARLGIVRQLCVPFVCRSSPGSMGDGDRMSRLTVGQSLAFEISSVKPSAHRRCNRT
jgi:hypothetical protein